MIDLAAAALAALLSRAPGPAELRAAATALWSFAEPSAPPVDAPAFRPEDGSVSTWRSWTRRTLEPAPLAAAAALFATGRPVVTRCVKLNNPWCIKRARWPGEIGADDEGHTAFASTEAGADAAATLLRTYYVSLGRRTALDIVRRWAPAECRGGADGLTLTLALGGLGNTLRARFLAGRTGTAGRSGTAGGTGTAQPRRSGARAGAPRIAVSRVPLAPLPSFRVPDLVPGLGERSVRTAAGPADRRVPSVRAVAAAQARAAPPIRLASASGPTTLPTAAICGSEEGRIRYYATAIGRALGVEPATDLKLFDEAGEPTANLLPVMVAMSAIELGSCMPGRNSPRARSPGSRLAWLRPETVPRRSR